MTASSDSIEIFRQEASELLEQLEAALLDLERSPSDRNLINSAFRALHTIKGSGAMFGFDEVAAFAHEFESAFDRVRKGDAEPAPDLIAIALNAKDFLRMQIEKPGEASAVIGVCILSDLRKLVQGPSSASALTAAAAAAEPASGAPPLQAAPAQRKWRVGIRFHKDVLINGSNPLLLLDELRGLGDCHVAVHTEATPPLEEMDPAACYFSWDVFLDTAHPRSVIEDVFIFVASEMELEIEELTGAPAIDVAASGAAIARAAEPVPSAPLGGEATPAATEVGAKHEVKEAATIRVQAERLDEMMDRVGELVIAQARLTQLASAGASAKGVAEDIERLTSSLRDAMMGIRMLPIGSLFGRFRRLVHDVSRDLGKHIELVTEGEETELDKTMIERLADPLIHVIRNAADHGLESAEARQAAGKDPVGRIRLVARHAGAEVLISVSRRRQGDRSRRASAPRRRKMDWWRPAPSCPRPNFINCCSCPASPRRSRFRRCRVAASAWTWCAAPSKACAARSTSSANSARARPSHCACR